VKIDDGEAGDDLVLNLTPLIDVVFLLLVFFMLTTTFLDPERELDIDLPQAESGAPLEEEDLELVINVFADGRITLAGDAIEPAVLKARLEAAAQRDPDTPVTIRGDRRVEHGDIVGVMDACGLAGLYNLSVGTLEGS